MTDLERIKPVGASGRSRHAFRNATAGTCAVALAGLLAMVLLNQAPRGAPPVFSPMSGVLLVAGCLLAWAMLVFYYARRTDEHDLNANLWGMSWGFLVLVTIPPAWWLLNRSGVAGPIDFWAIYFAGFFATAIGWTWLRYQGWTRTILCILLVGLAAMNLLQ